MNKKHFAIPIPSRSADGITLSGFSLKRLSGGQSHRLFSTLPLLVIVLCALFGSVLTFTSMFHIPFSAPIVYATMAACAVVFTLSCRYPLSMLAVYPVALIAIAVTAAACRTTLLRGFSFVCANVVEGINVSMYWNNPAQEYVWHPSYTQYTTLLLCLAAAVLCMLICLFVVWKQSVIGLFLVTFPFFEIGAAFGCVPAYLPVLLMLAAIAAVFVFKMAGVKNRKAKDGSDFVRRGRKHVYAQSGQPVVGVGLAVTAVLAAVALFAGQLVPRDAERSAEMAALREDIKTAFNDFITSGFSGNEIGLVDGDLAMVGDRVIRNKEHLTVTIPKLDRTEYLRGFVGSRYTGTEWTPLADYGDAQQMWNNFGAAGLYPQDFQAAALSALAQSDRKVGGAYKTMQVSSTLLNKDYSLVLGASNLKEDTPFSYRYDAEVLADSRSDYRFGAFFGEVGLNRIRRSPLFNDQNFRALWTQYSDWVHEHYVEVPDSMRSFKALYTTIHPRTDIYAYGAWVRRELAQDCVYSMEAERMPRGSDFVENFMFQTKQGYCVHFASAATMLFRAAGIPARYCEGYVITPDKCTKDCYDRETDSYTVRLTDADAHAWVEIYDDDAGWVHYEVTPGFYQGAQLSGEEPEGGDKKDERTQEEILKELEELGLDETQQGTNQNLETNSLYIAILDGVRIWSICCILAAILFLLGGLLALRRYAAIRRRRRRFAQGQNERRVRAAYAYFDRILFFELIRNEDNKPYLRYAQEAAARSPYLDPDETRRAMEIFLQARFSTEPVSDEQAEAVIAFVERYAETVYRHLTPVNRWIFATVRNLY